MTEEGSNWVFKNKDHGMMSAAASLGMVLLWNVDEGLNQIDKFFHNTEDYIKAGACLAVGIVSSGVSTYFFVSVVCYSYQPSDIYSNNVLDLSTVCMAYGF